MSRIYFHTRTHTAELRGSERGWLRSVASNAARGWWGLDTVDNLDRALEIVNMIVPGGPGQYVRDRAAATGQLADRDRLSAMPLTGDRQALVADYAKQASEDLKSYRNLWNHYSASCPEQLRNVHYDPSAKNALVDILYTCLRVTDVPLQIGEHVVSSANVELNTALATGNDEVCLAAKIHGWCEIHPWIEENDRPWFADTIGYAVASGVYRDGIWCTGSTDERQWVRQGWDDVAALLCDVDQHPGAVVLSYSVCDEFPNPEVSTTMPPWPAGVPHRWDALTDDQQQERRDAQHVWYDLEADQRWDTAMDGIRLSQPWANITPENLAVDTFGPNVSLFDVFHPDRIERVRVAFEEDAQAEVKEEERRAAQPA